MTRDETIALFLQGRETWNAWARRMLAERKALEDAGDWAADSYVFPLSGKNEKTKDWIARAYADFTNCRVIKADVETAVENSEGSRSDNDTPVISLEPEDEAFDCSSFHFPGYAGFHDVHFHVHADFESAHFHDEANFSDAQFRADAFFAITHFCGDASFYDAQFHSRAYFPDAQFYARVNFTGAHFHALTDFPRARFLESTARFSYTRFNDKANFASAEFRAPADFRDSRFSDSAHFPSAQFYDLADFRNATFGTTESPVVANFTGIKAERVCALTGTTFSAVPSFNQADFAQAPDLDGVTYPISGFWQRGNRDDIAKYRHLRRIALGGHNHDAEAMAFKGEIRAKRFTEHRGQPLVLIAGMIYDAVSDFGRSILRPLLVWLLSMPVFMVIYLINAGKLSVFDHACNGSAYWLSALVFSVKSALLVVPWDDQQIRSAYTCLYDVNFSAGEIVPPVSAFIQAGQTVLSAVVVFLLLLGIRNQFKIK